MCSQGTPFPPFFGPLPQEDSCRRPQVGYLSAGIKDVVTVGATMLLAGPGTPQAEALPSCGTAKPMLFASVYPVPRTPPIN